MFVYLVVVRMEADLDESTVDDVLECEERIVSQSRALLTDSSQDQMQQHKPNPLDKILRPLGLETRLVVLERANGIALSFICMTLSAIVSLRDQWSSRQLRHIVESVFTFLSGAKRPIRLKRLLWPLTDYEKSSELLSSLQGKQRMCACLPNLAVFALITEFLTALEKGGYGFAELVYLSLC